MVLCKSQIIRCPSFRAGTMLKYISYNIRSSSDSGASVFIFTMAYHTLNRRVCSNTNDSKTSRNHVTSSLSIKVGFTVPNNLRPSMRYDPPLVLSVAVKSKVSNVGASPTCVPNTCTINSTDVSMDSANAHHSN